MTTSSPQTHPAHRAWTNSVIRDAIIQHTDAATLARLTRVDKATMRAVVPVLWSDMKSPQEVHRVLGLVKSSIRYLLYSRSIRHIDNIVSASMVIAPLLLTYPSLRSSSTGVHRCEWKSAEVWENTEAVFEILAGFMDAATWTTHTTRLAQCLPEDWSVIFGPQLLDIPHDTFITQLQARLETGDIRLNNLQIGPLSTEKWTTLMSLLARCIQRGIAKHITYDKRIRKQDGTIGVAVHSERVRQLRQLLGHTESITLVGLYLQYSAIYDMRALLRGFRALNIMVDPWNNTQGRYFLHHMDERRLYAEGGYKLEGVVCRVVLNPDAFPVASLALVLDAIAADTTWLGQLARCLLTIGGPTVRYELSLQNNGGSRFSSAAADNARMTNDSAAYTRRLNDIIATIVDCRRQAAPAGWRRNAKGATYLGVVFAREVADVRWSPARVPVKNPLTRSTAGKKGSGE